MKKIKKYLNTELNLFNEKYYETIKSDVTFIDIIVKYVLSKKGKQIRPILVFLVSKLFDNKVSENSYKAAVTLELIHNASLYHDDVVDKASTRRGMATVNAIWNNKTAVLLGDYFLSSSLMSILAIKDFAVMDILSSASKRLSKGEFLQIAKARKLNTDLDLYYEVIKNKTASLFSACTELGAICSGATKEEVVILAEFGEKIGLIFQMQDDLLDFIGKKKIFGKEIGIDLVEKKITLPLIHALNNVSEKERKKVIKVIKKGVTNKNIEEIILFTEKNGGIEKCRNEIKQLVEEAKTIIEKELSKTRKIDTKAQENLFRFAEFLTRRIL